MIKSASHSFSFKYATLSQGTRSNFNIFFYIWKNNIEKYIGGRRMSSNFKNEELVKVQGKMFPVVGGRLRLAHEENKSLNIETKVISFDSELAVVQALVKTEKGFFNGLGNASLKRDRVLANAILELAETRAIARALRFAGYGVEYTGFEEVENAVKVTDDEKKATRSMLLDIFSKAKELNMSNDDLQELIQRTTGKKYSKDLTTDEAKIVLNTLKIKDTVKDNDVIMWNVTYIKGIIL